jgi:uncharacterized protein (DUF924 family)
MSEAMERQVWVGDVLRFWFEECVPEQWFKKDDAFDAALNGRFGSVHRHVAALAHEDCVRDADTALAAAIVLDQFSRNMFRGTPAAFASDPKAFGIAEPAVSRGLDRGLETERRQFFYLPFEHSEDAEVQKRSVALFATLGPEALRWAEAHKVIIDRFGRFPHRNAILGRVSTPEEIEFLAGPNSSF